MVMRIPRNSTLPTPSNPNLTLPMTVDPVALRVFVYETIVSAGLPPSLGQIGNHFATTADDARQALASLKIGKTILVHPRTGEIWMAGPFASAPTSYRVTGSRCTWFANCAWDMLGIPVIVGEPVVIHATCTDCGELIEMAVDPRRGVARAEVVHFLVPARRWYDDIGFT